MVGFGSSMVFGTVVGSFADRRGRKFNCVLYGVLYGVDCLTKHIPNYWVLLVGRVAGGMATSILFSAFESWVVCEHGKQGFSKDLLSDLFSNAILGNSLVAIISGLVAQVFASHFGFIAPFSLSFVLLVTMSGIICCCWTENYGNITSDTRLSVIQHGIQVIRQDPKVFCLGLIQSLFEGSMYSFVLEWTPALTPDSQVGIKNVDHDNIPHGWIFASFMVSVMLGSHVFKLLYRLTYVESLLRPVFGIAALSLTTPIVFSKNQPLVFVGFLVFEFCVGVFWPAMGVLRSKYVPESARATVMNIFRVPLNLIVISLLVQDLPLPSVFCCCVVFLSICCAVQQWLFFLSFRCSSSTDEVRGEADSDICDVIRTV